MNVTETEAEELQGDSEDDIIIYDYQDLDFEYNVASNVEECFKSHSRPSKFPNILNRPKCKEITGTDQFNMALVNFEAAPNGEQRSEQLMGQLTYQAPAQDQNLINVSIHNVHTTMTSVQTQRQRDLRLTRSHAPSVVSTLQQALVADNFTLPVCANKTANAVTPRVSFPKQAMFLNRNGRMVQCPIVIYHKVRMDNLQKHLIKCRQNHPDSDYVISPFNASHHVLKKSEESHSETCPDQFEVDYNGHSKQLSFLNQKINTNYGSSNSSFEEDPDLPRSSLSVFSSDVKLLSTLPQKENQSLNDPSAKRKEYTDMNAKRLRRASFGLLEPILKHVLSKDLFFDLTLSTSSSPHRLREGHKLLFAGISKKIASEVRKKAKDQAANSSSPVHVQLNISDESLDYLFQIVYQGEVEISPDLLETFSEDLRILNIGDQLGTEVEKFALDEQEENTSTESQFKPISNINLPIESQPTSTASKSVLKKVTFIKQEPQLHGWLTLTAPSGKKLVDVTSEVGPSSGSKRPRMAEETWRKTKVSILGSDNHQSG